MGKRKNRAELELPRGGYVARKPFTCGGREYDRGDEFPGRDGDVGARRFKQLIDARQVIRAEASAG